MNLKTACVSGALFATLALYELVAHAAEEPGARDSSPESFSEERARPIVAELSESIGPRVPGSAGHQEAARALIRRLAAIARVQVEQQDVTGLLTGKHASDGPLFYRVVNVVARLEGRQPEAVLLSAHFDTPPGLAGAADDAVGVAALIEIARALASGPPLERSVVFNFSGNEEYCLCGAAAFLSHRWSRDVRQFINLDATGLGGRAILFQAGPAAWSLLDAYATVPRPYGTVVAQDLFEHGLVPAGTDGYLYRDAGLPGLDLALFEDGYAIHTPLDRLSRLEPGSLQHMGDSALAATRALAMHAGQPAERTDRMIYYDVLGGVFVHYPARVARCLAAGVLALTGGAIIVGARRLRISIRNLAARALVVCASVILGLLLPLCLSGLPSWAFQRPHGWFDAPWLARICYGAWAVVGALLPRMWLTPRRPAHGLSGARRTFTDVAAGAALWCLLLVLLECLGLGSSYVALWWAAGSGLGLLGVALLPDSWRAPTLALGWLPGMMVTLPVADSLLDLFVPIAGRLPTPWPLDSMIAILAATPVLAASVTGLAWWASAERVRRPSAILASTGLASWVALILHPPYSEQRPKRLYVSHEERASDATLLISSADHLDPAEALASLAATPTADGAPGKRQTYVVPAGAATLPPPSVRVVEATPLDAQGERTVRLLVLPSSDSVYRITLRMAKETLLGWSFPAAVPPGPLQTADSPVIQLIAPTVTGTELMLRIKGAPPATLELEQRTVAAPAPLASAIDRLPSWTTAKATVATFSVARL